MTAIILAAGQALRRVRITAIPMDTCDAFRRSSDTKNPSPLWVLSVSTFLRPKSLLIVRSTWTTIVGASICTGWLKPVCPIPCQRVDIGAGGGYCDAVLAFPREEGRGDRLFWHPVKPRAGWQQSKGEPGTWGDDSACTEAMWTVWRSSVMAAVWSDRLPWGAIPTSTSRGSLTLRGGLCALPKQEVLVEVMQA